MPGALLVTPRLVLRVLGPADADVVAAYRSDPAVARFQSWSAPYPLASAQALVAEMAALDGIVADEWCQIGLADPATDELLGDVAVHVHDEGRQAEIGYTLAPGHQGRGLATEAVGALVDHLFAARGVERVHASVDPRNVASARVLERLGFEHEGTAPRSVWSDGEWADDDRYAVHRTTRRAWLDRPRDAPAEVQLVPVDDANVDAVIAVRLHRSQERFVSPTVRSLAQVAVPPIDRGAPVVPWPRAVAADGGIIGFVMLAEPRPVWPEWYLWRLCVDRRHQQRGIGHRVLDAVVRHVQAAGGRSVLVGWVPGVGSPEPFYLARGFVPTGDVEDGEIIARLSW
jgi:RimJ/RimL family protein N-acetyltransferase